MGNVILKRVKRLFCCLLVVVLLMPQNVHLYAAESLPAGTVFTEGGLKYQVMRDFYNPPTVELLGPEEGTVVTGELVIGQVVHEGITYAVDQIAYDAFQNCTELTSVRILDGVRIISFTGTDTGAFMGCSNLQTVVLPDSMTTIGYKAFKNCSSLTSINIPAGVTVIYSEVFSGCTSLNNINIPNGVTKIESSAFNGCSGLTHIELPNSLVEIENAAFMGCTSLTGIVIPKNCTRIESSAFLSCTNLTTLEMYDSVTLGKDAFSNCSRLGTLKLHIGAADDTVTRTVGCSGGDPFVIFFDNSVERNLIFLTEDGTQQLSGQTIPTLTTAQNAYQQVADGNTIDNFWYSWNLGSIPSSYAIDIQIKKDNVLWNDHGKQFRLSKDGTVFADDFTIVEDGTYHIYEVTASGNVDTGVEVTVNGADAEAEINYYTVTFYDGDTAYGNETDWEPQIVLAGGQVQAPTVEPSKTDYTFDQWVREENGRDAYEFGEAITDTTSIYASWSPVVADEHIIRATAGEGGSISPDGSVRVTDKAEQIFTITPQSGYHISSVMVDGIEQGTSDRYTFTDVQEDHEILVSFEVVDKPDKTEEPNEPNIPVKPDVSEGSDNTGDLVVPDNSENTENIESTESTDSTGSTDSTDSTEAPQTSTEATTAAPDNTTPHRNKGPRTGDMFRIELYATVAMISGLSYLMLCFTNPDMGMTEEEKKARVAAWIRWAKQGGVLRRYVALVAIFFLLLYYHQQANIRGIKRIV